MGIADRVNPHILELQAYQPGKPIEELERELGIVGAIKLASNENPLGPSPLAVEAVQNAIDELPSHYRQAVQLHLLEGKSLDEVSSIMNRGPRAIQGLVDRAKKKLVAVHRESSFERRRSIPSQRPRT